MERKATEHKSFGGIQSKILDAEQGIVEHIVAVMGNVDMGGDIIHPGAFTKTLAERGLKVRVCDQHNTHSVLNVLGHPVEIREIGRGELPTELLMLYPEATGALVAKTQYNMETPEGRGAFKRIAAGDIGEYSIGYDAIEYDYSQSDSKERVRNLREVRLWEYSPVIWGMNPATMTLSAKSVIPASDLPIAPREREWDSTAAEARVRTWADAEEEPNARYRRAFMWYDAENADQFGAYKLQYADVVDGELHAIPRAIFSIAGGRGVRAADIPDADKTRIEGMVNRWYARMREEFDDEGIVSPFEKAAPDPQEAKVGRAISKANAERIAAAIDAIQTAAAQLEELIGGMIEDEPAPDEDAEKSHEAGPVQPPTSERERKLRLIAVNQRILEEKR